MAYISITPHHGTVRVLWRGHTIASSSRALDLVEGSGRPVVYIPREDADPTFLQKTARSSHCPHKGNASYFSLRDGTETAENAVWSDETPLESVAPIGGYLAFYPDRVTIAG